MGEITYPVELMVMNIQRDLFTGEAIPDRKSGPQTLRKANGHVSNGKAMEYTTAAIEELKVRIVSLEKTILQLRDIICQQQPTKESYGTHEIASILGRKPYTVREWCRLQRIHGFKAMCGRGSEEEWRISHEELCRIQNEGLLPAPDRY